MPQTSAPAAQPPFVDLELSWTPGTSSLPGFLGTGWRWKLISFQGFPEGRHFSQVIPSFPVPHIPQIPWGSGKLGFSLLISPELVQSWAVSG